MSFSERIVVLATAYIAGTVYVCLELPYYRPVGIGLSALCLVTTIFIFKNLPSALRG